MPPFEVTCEVAVQFGMLECSPVINAETCVYDPQSAYRPLKFKDTGSHAGRLAVVLNRVELARLMGRTDPQEAALRLLDEDGADAVIVKNGVRGALVVSRAGSVRIPAYYAESVFTIGSGDVFVAAFALAWGIRGMDADWAADYASRATAAYVESSALPMVSIEDALEHKRKPAVLREGKIYLAGPFREPGQRFLVNDARRNLSALGMEVFSPVHDIGHGTADEVVALDLAALESCDAVFAILNGTTPGTLFEVGYATAHKKPVFCVAQNVRESDQKLPIGSGCHVYSDYVTALHQIAWRT